MYYFLTLIGSFAAFLLLAYLRYLTIRMGLKDRNYTQVQHSLKENKRLDNSSGFLGGSKVIQNEPEDKDRYTRPKKKKRLPFRNTEDIKRSYIIDAILDKPKWRQEMNENEW